MLQTQHISTNEQEIIYLLEQGNDACLDLIYKHYSNALYGVLCKILPSTEQAEDALQATMVKVWKNKASYSSSKGRLFTWLVNIARNTALDELRSKNQKKSNNNLPLDKVQGYVEQTLVTNSNVNNIGLQKVLQSLPLDQQRLVQLMYFQGYTQQEIADEIPMPLGTVKTKLRNALLQLRKVVQQ